ncbi:MAG: 30S ribosomal protein S16 [Bacilli bacterium]
MVKLRLQRFGKKKSPYYRIVATDSRNPRNGRFIEIIGLYQPVNKDNQVKLDEEKAMKWLEQGARPTDTVRSIFKQYGLNERLAKSKVKKA